MPGNITASLNTQRLSDTRRCEVVRTYLSKPVRKMVLPKYVAWNLRSVSAVLSTNAIMRKVKRYAMAERIYCTMTSTLTSMLEKSNAAQ